MKIFSYFKFVSLLLIVFISNQFAAFAQNKVVVIPLGESESKTARSGQLFTGQLAVTYAPNSTTALAQISFPTPLPANTPVPTLEYLSNTTSANCPGIGSSSPGILCVYAYFETNINSAEETTGETGENRLHGYALALVPTNSGNQGFLLASWAYEVP